MTKGIGTNAVALEYWCRLVVVRTRQKCSEQTDKENRLLLDRFSRLIESENSTCGAQRRCYSKFTERDIAQKRQDSNMAHEIEGQNCFFVGQPAWHGLGTILENAPSIADGIVCAGLDWKAELQPMFLGDGTLIPQRRAVVRDTDSNILGTVGVDYTVLQNSEAFAWFQPLIETGDCALEAAGSLRGGSRIWVLAKLSGTSAEIAKNDLINSYVLLAHSHDGSLAVQCGFTTVRVVCQNTLSMALNSGSKLLKIKHTKNVNEALSKARAVMDIARRDFAATAEQMRALVRLGCSEDRLKRYVREVFCDASEVDNERAGTKMVNKIIPLFESGRGTELQGVRGTMWGAYNAVTEFLTHERGRSVDGRVESQWFGKSANDINNALTVALKYAA